MDAEYICPKLIKWAELFYGKGGCWANEMRDGSYAFGNEKNENFLTTPVAIFLVVGELPVLKEKKKKRKGKKKKKRRRTK